MPTHILCFFLIVKQRKLLHEKDSESLHGRRIGNTWRERAKRGRPVRRTISGSRGDKPADRRERVCARNVSATESAFPPLVDRRDTSRESRVPCRHAVRVVAGRSPPQEPISDLLGPPLSTRTEKLRMIRGGGDGEGRSPS
ncbi:hypothetical protein MTO96_013777 [Rhipicephalus appendiculatus]